MRLITRPFAHLSVLILLGFVLVAGRLADSATWLRTRSVRDQTGNVITDNLAWIVFGVVAIVVIGGLLETLGRSVVSWVTTQLGL